jgi:hypothetical protein
MKDDVARWLGPKEAGRYVGYSPEWVEVRATPWEDDPVDGRIRFKLSRSDGRRRYFVPDLRLRLVDRQRQSLPARTIHRHPRQFGALTV